MDRDPAAIQREIEQARLELGRTLDQLVVRTSPKRMVAKGRAGALDFLATTKGKLIVGGAAAALVGVVVLNHLRNR